MFDRSVCKKKKKKKKLKKYTENVNMNIPKNEIT